MTPAQPGTKREAANNTNVIKIAGMSVGFLVKQMWSRLVNA